MHNFTVKLHLGNQRFLQKQGILFKPEKTWRDAVSCTKSTDVVLKKKRLSQKQALVLDLVFRWL